MGWAAIKACTMAMIQKENGYFLYSEEIGLKRFGLIRTQMSSEWTYFGTAFPLGKNISSREEFFQAPCLGELSREKYRSEEHTSELQSHSDLVCRLLLEKKKKKKRNR